ncbi:MAG: hypothetical protein O2955_03800 [Planctomycetota bacterium]|nr:hypothetical protein [Planctomycetota bacterium]MDA1211612.1 hypothetical protein [Planctomycetota bacterium]
MTQQELLDEFLSLPSAAQREVADFIAFLKQKHLPKKSAVRADENLQHEEFIGMWRDREDLAASTDWVRDMRKDEWSN